MVRRYDPYDNVEGRDKPAQHPKAVAHPEIANGFSTPIDRVEFLRLLFLGLRGFFRGVTRSGREAEARPGNNCLLSALRLGLSETKAPIRPARTRSRCVFYSCSLILERSSDAWEQHTANVAILIGLVFYIPPFLWRLATTKIPILKFDPISNVTAETRLHASLYTDHDHILHHGSDKIHIQHPEEGR